MGRATRWLKGLFGIKREKETSSGDQKGKNRSSFGISSKDPGGLCNNPATIPPNISTAEAAWIRSYYSETEKEQNKHAIAVAAATAAAADAAVAAAQAAVAVVRLTSHGRGTMFGGGHERWAAVKIQAVFRGYLARKAHRALKGLVKLQALVRGYLVRRQATATLHCMQALIRAQATVRSQKARSINRKDTRLHTEFHRARKSFERFDDTRSDHTASFHRRRLSASLDGTINLTDESPKIVEVDTGRPKSRSRRTTNISISDFADDPHSQTLSSPLPCQIPGRLSIPDCRNFHDSEWVFTGEECRFSTAQSTPRFSIPVTPAKSVCADTLFRQQYSNHPNYMANTQSFKAKLRSYSAPKQRPEPGPGPGPKKMLSLTEIMESRSSLSGVRMQRSSQEAIDFKNAVMGKLDMHCLQRRW